MKNQQNSNQIEKMVIEVVANCLGLPVKNVLPTSFLYDDLNASKLEIAEMIQSLEEKFNIKFEIEAVKNFKTVADLIDYLSENVE